MGLNKMNKHSNKEFKQFKNNQEYIISKRILPYRMVLTQIQDAEFAAHRVLEIIYVIKGSVKIQVRHNVHTLYKGDFYIIPSNKAHNICPKTEDHILLIFQIQPEYLENNFGIPGDSIFVDNINSLGMKNKVVNSLGLLYLESLNNQSDINIHNTKLELLANSIKPYLINDMDIEDEYENNTVESIVWDIVERYSDKTNYDVSLEKTAEDYNISYSYLSRKFKDVVGVNFTDYFLKQKLNNALDLLINTDKTVTKISELTGFFDIKALNRNFRNTFNISPTDFRSKYKGNNKSNKSLLNHKAVEEFIKKIEKERDENLFVEDNSYKIDIADYNGRNEGVWGEVIDSSFVVNSAVDNVEKVLLDSTFKNIVIKMQFIDNDFVLIMKDKLLKELSKEDYSKLIRAIDNSNVVPIIQLDFISNNKKIFYEKEDEFYKKYKSKMTLALDLISKVIGTSRLSMWKFELYIPEINRIEVEGRKSNILIRHIDNFVNILTEKFGEDGYSWGLYIGKVEATGGKNTINHTRKLKNLSHKPEFYTLDLDYYHNSSSPEAGNIILEDKFNFLINRIREDLDIHNSQMLIVSFNYIIEDLKLLDEHCEYNVIYYNLFLKSILLSIKQENFYIASCKVISGIKENANYNVFYNELGIRLPPYYISNFVQNLKREIIHMEDGCIVTKDGRDISILLYTNYEQFYKHRKNLFQIDNDQFKNKILLEINGLEGKYKVTEYQIDYRKDIYYRRFIKELDINTINKAEKAYIGSRITPDMKIKFLNVENTFKYSTNLKFLGGSLIKLQSL